MSPEKQIALLESRVAVLEEFATVVAEFLKQMEVADDEIEDDGERQRWRAAHDAARARRRNERKGRG